MARKDPLDGGGSFFFLLNLDLALLTGAIILTVFNQRNTGFVFKRMSDEQGGYL